MALVQIPFEDAVPRLGEFDCVIDARSPAEFAEDHLPGAVNWPVLDDDERKRVGTLYKQVSPLEARKVGAALVARNIAAHVERHCHDRPRHWKPLVYCWRGGQRSGSLAWFLGQIGFRTAQLAGGYKGFRAIVRRELETLPPHLTLHMLCGRTGSGKTRLLQALREAGAQVLDLEALACHRGSVLGRMPEQPQPSQKRFDTLLWQALRSFDSASPVWVESESQKIGRLRVPDALIGQMRQSSHCVRVEMPEAARIELLLQDYAFFADDAEAFCGHLDVLIELRGRATVQAWQEQARAGRWAEVFAALMRHHYDPLYERSMARNFTGLEQARQVLLTDPGPQTFAAAAQALLQVSEPTAAAPV